MNRRLQLVGSIGVPLGAIALAAVALVVAMGLQQQLADATARVDNSRLSPRAFPNWRPSPPAYPEREGAATGAAALEPRVRALEDAPAASLDAVHPMLSAQGSAWWTPKAKSAVLRMFDDRGTSQVFVGVTTDGPELTVKAPGPDTNDAGASLRITESGLPHLGMVDRAGRPRAALGLVSTSNDGGPGLVFLNSRETQRLAIGSGDAGPQVFLYDANKAPRIRLGYTTSGPTVALHNASDAERLSLELNEAGAGIAINDVAGETRTGLVVTASGSSLVFLDAHGATRTNLGSDEAGRSRPRP
ncbi:MAG: hypothetical protein OXG79_09110 [Chloroflexi bacterium]|nr:hypothetical protein [Chloroflexota bacterium]